MSPDSANTLQVTDLRLAASYRGLGFRYVCEPVIHERSDTLRTQFLFELTSLRFPSLNLRDLHQSWRTGQLKVQDPMHVLCVMMAAHANYDAFLSMTKDKVQYRLKSVSGGCLTRYFQGEERCQQMFNGKPLVNAHNPVRTDDMRLAASVGLLGIPVLEITEPERGRHVFTLAKTGYPVKLASGELHLYDAARLIEREPTSNDPLRLRMEGEQPLHPLCIAYDALFNRTELKKELERPSMLLIDAPGQRITGGDSAKELLAVKQALVDVNAKGHVMDQVAAHMQSPPIHWS